MAGPIGPRVIPHYQPAPPRQENWLQTRLRQADQTRKNFVSDQLARLKPVTDGIGQLTREKSWGDKIARLDSKGDTAVSSTAADAKAELSGALRLTRGRSAVKGGASAAPAAGGKSKVDADVLITAKGQVNHSISVKRDADTANSTYTVSYAKSSAAGLGLEGVLKTGKGAGPTLPGGLPMGFEGKLKGEGAPKVTNTVEMRFANAQDAARGAEINERVQAADMTDDAVRAGAVAPGMGSVAALPLAAHNAQLIDGSPNNLMNGLSEHGRVNPGLLRAAGVSDADMKFLQDHMTAQEFSVAQTQRIALEGKADAELSKLTQKIPLASKLQTKGAEGAELRGDRESTFTRRVDYPSTTAPGSITDRIDVTDRATLKVRDGGEKAQADKGKWGGLPIKPYGQSVSDGIYDLGSITTSMSRSTAVAPGTVVDAGTLATANTGSQQPITVKQTMLTADVSELAQLSGDERRDMHKTSTEYEVAADKAPHLLAGTVAGFSHGTVHLLDPKLTAVQTGELVMRDGQHTQTGFKGGLDGVAGVEGTIIRSSGIDDYAKAPEASQPPEQPQPQPEQAPSPEPFRIQVQPYRGANIRSEPSIDAGKVGIVQMGSFLDATGQKQVDAEGQEWLKVKGRDQTDQVKEGWVRGDMVKTYEAERGNNDNTGRMNPSRDGQRTVTVKEGDNLWTIARREKVGYPRLLEANPHLLDRAVIFAGDSVYLPAGR